MNFEFLHMSSLIKKILCDTMMHVTDAFHKWHHLFADMISLKTTENKTLLLKTLSTIYGYLTKLTFLLNVL